MRAAAAAHTRTVVDGETAMPALTHSTPSQPSKQSAKSVASAQHTR